MSEQVTYKIDCITCNSSNTPPDPNNTPQIYIGQSGRSIHARMSDHLKGVKNGKGDCPLYKHQLEKHLGSRDHSNFEMKIIEKFRKNMQRLLNESHNIIKHNTTHKLMNSKSEYSKNKIVRYVVSTEKH